MYIVKSILTGEILDGFTTRSAAVAYAKKRRGRVVSVSVSDAGSEVDRGADDRIETWPRWQRAN